MAGFAKHDGWFDLNASGYSLNGDNVAKFVAPTALNNVQGFGDFTNVMTYFSNSKTDKESVEKYLGLIQLFSTTHKESVPMVADIVGDMAVMNVEDWQKVIYDIAIPSNARSAALMLNDVEVEGDIVNGMSFEIVLDRKFVPGDALKFALTAPYTLIVSREYDIEPAGDGWRHTVEFKNKDPKAIYPKGVLRVGTEWHRISHHMAEYGKDWAAPTMGMEAPGKIRMEVSMPSPQGVEVAYTMRGGNIRSEGAAGLANSTVDYLKGELDKLGGWDKSGMFLLGRAGEKGLTAKPKVALTLEYLAMKELIMMNAFTNMFSDSITQETEDGVIRSAEGVWFQCRRGKIITYPRPGALKPSHLAQAAAYVFKNSSIPIENRKMIFKGGREAVANGLELIREYNHSQINGLPSVFTGNNGILGKMITGNIDDLRLSLPRFQEAFFPQVGHVRFEHDPSFDFQPFGRRRDVGFTTNGYNNLSYSLMVDGIDVMKSDIYKNVGANLIEGGNKKSNFYYLKPENHIWWGRTQGRMNEGDKFTDIKASLRYMGSEFFAAMQSYILMVDTTAKVIIELQDTYNYY